MPLQPPAETRTDVPAAAPPSIRARRRFERARPAPARPPIRIEPPEIDSEPLQEIDSRFRRAVVAADLAALGVAFAVLAASGAQFQFGAGLLTVVALLIAKASGLYDRDDLVLRKTTLEEAPRIALNAALTVLAAWLLEALAFTQPLEHGMALEFWAVLLPATVAARTAARLLAQRHSSEERLLLIGDRRESERLQRALAGGSAARLVARIPPDRILVDAGNGRPTVSLAALDGLVRWFGAHRIIVSGHDASPEATLELFRAAKGVGVRLSFLPTVLATVGPRVAFDDVWGIPLIGVRRFGLSRTQRLAKRAFDLVGTFYVLLVVAPILALFALAIRLDSPGPVFFRQPRVGRDGRVFSIFKFRTMVADAEARKVELRAQNEAGGGLFKIENDPRITRVGRLLRRTSLDELPQLFNVLRGEMSLVGPRPLVLDEDEQILGFDRRRLHLTPGMTGHWQILGSARVPLDEMVRIDYRYVASWSLWEDLKIMLRTVPYMLARRGM